ncbi:MAG TPA: adenylate/guanylate cyclase domain-containing protein [Phototrophicaceae bacterium]|nr:adenylate/guanylate cyclase domain-containing protein [Phototrophicaceae bacterium]
MPLDASFHEDVTRFLPAPLLERLPSLPAITEALQHLNSLYRALISFLPLYIAEEEITNSPDYRALRQGTFMFADVSGFTALSERLAQENSTDGAEILTIIMNDYFAEMLEILAKSDGQLLKFAGDALLVFFPDYGAELADLHKAIRAGWRMQRAIKRFQPISDPRLVALLGGEHSFELTSSVGIARGKLFEALVGTNVQRDHLIQGELPGRAMDAEAAGKRDDVIIGTELANLVSDQYELVRLNDDFYQVIDNQGSKLDDYEFDTLRRRRPKSSAVFDLSANSLMDHLRNQLVRVNSVACYVAPSVLHELVLSSDYHLRSENRFSTTLFIYATGFAEALRDWGDDHLDQVVALMSRYYTMVQRVVTARGGTLTRTDPYNLGIKLLATFGAPIAHPDDPDRAVDAALELTHHLAQYNHRVLEELPPELRRDSFVTQRIGVTLGIIFAGEVGWKARREYTVMGDEVNLAARLMTKAQPGQILISERVYERVRDSFEAEKVEPLHLKGKSLPVQAYAVKNVAAPTITTNFSSQMPFIGHDVFMLSLTYTLKQANSGRRRAVALVGDAGIGKTRIAQQLAKAATSSKFQVAWATCTSRNGRKTTWATLVGQLLGIDPSKDTPQARKTIHDSLRDLNRLDLESVILDLIFDSPLDDGVVAHDKLNTSFFDSQLHEAKDDSKSGGSGLFKQVEQRMTIIEGIVEFLKAFTEKTPTLLVIDDLQQENAQALQGLQHILNEIKQAKLVVAVTYEPTLSVELDAQTLVVPDLSAEDTDQVALAILHASELGPNLKKLIWERTSGRPLFIEALLRTLLQEGYLNQVEGVAELKPDASVETLPDDVRELVISRLDSFSPETQTVLRAASALTEDFLIDELQAVSEAPNLPRLRSIVADLTKAQVLEKINDDLFRFRHGLTQSIIYDSLARAQRLKLHRLAAGFWREHRDISYQPVELAFHLVKCGLLPEAIEVVTTAAEDAEKSGNIDRAIELYTHALTIFPDDHSIDTQLERLSRLQEGQS